MHKNLWLITFFTLLLFGCTAKEADTSYLKNYVDNPQITSDAKLIEPNDRQSSSKGSVELTQANFEKQEFTVGPMKLTFYDAKQIQVTPDISMIDYFHVLTTDEEFSIVKTFLSIENMGNELVQFNPAAFATTSTGEQWTWEQEAYLDELNGAYEPGQTKKGNVGFILEKKEKPKNFTLQTSDIFDAKKDIVSSGTKITLPLTD
ncbi:MAG: hypothetical protein KBT36_07425 [Kurthia sp.]|nr:hypothetical protein [Candidatus Kurthia equi]